MNFFASDLLLRAYTVPPAEGEGAFVQAMAEILLMSNARDARDAKLNAVCFEGENWTPEFVAKVQRRIDQVAA